MTVVRGIAIPLVINPSPKALKEALLTLVAKLVLRGLRVFKVPPPSTTNLHQLQSNCTGSTLQQASSLLAFVRSNHGCTTSRRRAIELIASVCFIARNCLQLRDRLSFYIRSCSSFNHLHYLPDVIVTFVAFALDRLCVQ